MAKEDKNFLNKYFNNLKLIFQRNYVQIIILIICLLIPRIYIQLKKIPEIRLYIINIINLLKIVLEKKETKFNNVKPEIIEEKKDVQNIKKHEQELVFKLKDVNKKLFDFLSLTDYYDKYIDNEDIIKNIRILREKYYSYKNIKRFSIPIIGSVNAGKSTLLNYLLNLRNFLETGSDITTRFFCIIRHNINYKTPVISNITIEERDDFKYNFMKDKILNKNEYNIDYIKKYNKFFSLKKNKRLKLEEKYFLLMEVDIPFFHGEFEKYADLIEFIDFPGLNEVDLKYMSENNIYFSEIIPFIQPNYLFSIFLFKLNDFSSTNFKEILINFLDVNYLDCIQEKYMKTEKFLRKVNVNKVFKESLFVLNKRKDYDRIRYLSEFKDYLNKNFQEKEIYINLEENKNILETNLKTLNLELNKYNSFEDYINYSIDTMDSDLIESIVDNLNRDFQLNLNYKNIVKIEKINLTSSEKEELNKINQIIFLEKLKDSQYKKLYTIFNENVLKMRKNVNKYDTLTEMVKNKIKTLINDYLNIEELYYLKKKFHDYFKTKGINDLEDDYNELVKIQEKKVNLNNPKEFINNFDKYMKELYNLKDDNNSSAIESLKNQFEKMKEYSSKKFLSSLLLIGEFKS